MVVQMAWIQSHGTYSIQTGNDPHNPDDSQVTFANSEPRDLQPPLNEDPPVSPKDEASYHPSLERYLDVASLANLATVQKVDIAEDSTSRWQANGDPTEIALQVFATRFGRSGQGTVSDGWKQLAEFPFDSSVKKMSVLCEKAAHEGEVHVFTKGAVERVLSSCVCVLAQGGVYTPMDEVVKQDILSNMEAMARQGLRVLAFAHRITTGGICSENVRLGRLNRDAFEQHLTFLGLIGILDPPRPESRTSVLKCHEAGIAVHMLTGDHPETARAIATDVGILPPQMNLVRGDIAKMLVMAAHEFDSLSDDDLDRLPELPLVVARCAPSTKVRMIDALHRRGKYVAMTGDGVNDGPSLKRADVGIAMGLGGSDVAKSASDIVLSDDNFASILNAVEEGRRIFDNVQKFMLHVLSANVAFVITLMVGLAYKDGGGTSIFQITPVEIIFMLLVAGACTETGLGFESASKHILKRPPQSASPSYPALPCPALPCPALPEFIIANTPPHAAREGCLYSRISSRPPGVRHHNDHLPPLFFHHRHLRLLRRQFRPRLQPSLLTVLRWRLPRPLDVFHHHDVDLCLPRLAAGRQPALLLPRRVSQH
jgi:P-type Na+/K+ transporter